MVEAGEVAVVVGAFDVELFDCRRKAFRPNNKCGQWGLLRCIGNVVAAAAAAADLSIVLAAAAAPISVRRLLHLLQALPHSCGLRMRWW